MAINLSKAKSLYNTAAVKSGMTGTSNSWSDFYINMALEMAENVAKNKIGAKLAAGANLDLLNNGFIQNNLTNDSLSNLNENYWFAQSLAEEYDKVVKSGFTLIGGDGTSVVRGNKELMQAALVGILSSTKLDKNGDLLRDIGRAVQAYWVGATLSKTPPTIPTPGAVKNIITVNGLVIFPGVWIPISIPPMNSVSPWLLNFVVSASLHLLTLSGLFITTSQYPPPMPPAPGVLPWFGYFVKPLSLKNPLTSLDFKDMVSLAGGTVYNVIDSGEGVTTDSVAKQLVKGFTEGSQSQVDRDFQAALKSIITNDEKELMASANNLNAKSKT
jgi:hypothetical protein